MILVRVILIRMILTRMMRAQMIAARAIMACTILPRMMPSWSLMRGMNLAPRRFIGGGGLRRRHAPFGRRLQRLFVIRRKRRVRLCVKQRKDRGGIEGLRRRRETRRPQDAQ